MRAWHQLVVIANARAARAGRFLLAWQQRADGWHGRVVHPVHEPDGWVVVEEWLPAGLLDPA